ncbi:3-phosphoshikimate 1-carboxyvinyltransferase [Eubacterium xylanophilum]|uniref:3-phosphoshikimate 1-carboxyvinyltransferase n=1 Tax=Eubacterium xylanophilum TaxID=39497 RepID=UPI00047B1314|nr:3-phosphoshikimate 1-carboxyvinyltransferase [Eubacterium xylanophilum]
MADQNVKTRYKCKKFPREKDIIVEVPGSKSITNRALLMGALADGKSTIKGVLFSDDSRVFMSALMEIGYIVEIDEDNHTVTIEGKPTRSSEEVNVYVGSAGTAARFITALLAFSGNAYYVESSEQMRKRPMKALLLALEDMGVEFVYEKNEYEFPFHIRPFRADKESYEVDLNIDASSQFLSAMLLSAPVLNADLTIRLTGERDAKSYVYISTKMMKEFGAEVEQIDENTYRVRKGQRYREMVYQVEPDVSAACYFYALAAVTAGRAVVKNVHFDSTQGDIKFVNVLEKMGCEISDGELGIEVKGPEGKLKGLDIRMSDFSDQTMTLAAIAPFSDGVISISGVEHIRRQESDRINAIVSELRRLGIKVDEREDGMDIYPGEIVPTEVETYDDHRMAMAFAVLGVARGDVVILNPECCSKTFENYFEILDCLMKI